MIPTEIPFRTARQVDPKTRAVEAFFGALAAGDDPPITAGEVVGDRRVEVAVYEQLGIQKQLSTSRTSATDSVMSPSTRPG